MGFVGTGQTTERQILSRIYGHGRGWAFSPQAFVDLAKRQTITTALRRHVQAGRIRSLGRGLYDYPVVHPKLGALAPTPDAVAKAIAGRDSARLQASGAYAANLLGLSTQVPARLVYLTDGRAGTVDVGGVRIELRRTTPRNLAAAGRPAGLVIQALRHIGRQHVTSDHVGLLRRALPPDVRRDLLKDLSLAPAWMHDVLREVAAP